MPLDIASRWGKRGIALFPAILFLLCFESTRPTTPRVGGITPTPDGFAQRALFSSLRCNGVCTSVLVRAKRLCLSGSITSPHACGSPCSVVSSLRVQNNRHCLFFVWKRVVEKVRQLCALPFYRFASLHGYGRKCSALLAFSSYAFKQKTKFCIIEGTQKPPFAAF